jgi:uncharacterized protein YjbI with pentapeptide repeats
MCKANKRLLNTDLPKATFRGVASLRSANADKAKFIQADLAGAHFFGASIKGADFEKAHFTAMQQSLKNDLRKRHALHVPN